MEPTRYVTLHFRDQRGAASLRHRHRAEITSLCVNRSPIRYDFCTSEKAIQCSTNIAYMVTTCTHQAPILQQLTVEPLYDSHFLWDRDGLHGRLKKRGEKKPKIFTAVKRVKFAIFKRNTSKLRLLLSLSKV